MRAIRMKKAMGKPGRIKEVAQGSLPRLPRLLIKSLTKRLRRPFQVHHVAVTIANRINL